MFLCKILPCWKDCIFDRPKNDRNIHVSSPEWEQAVVSQVNSSWDIATLAAHCIKLLPSPMPNSKDLKKKGE